MYVLLINFLLQIEMNILPLKQKLITALQIMPRQGYEKIQINTDI